MRAGIITIGNEILKGKTVNTNAAEIGRILYFSGYEIYRGLVVPDIESEIRWAFRSLVGLCNVIVSSGGLGPTFDDITVESFAHEFNIPLELNRETYDNIMKRTLERGLEMTREREKMALVPSGSKIIKNPVGSAPGIEFVIDNSKIFILPGVPKEMKSMMEFIGQEIKLNDSFYFEDSIIVKGIYEASLAPSIKKIMDKYGGSVYIKSHPSLYNNNESVIEIEVSAKGVNLDEAKMIVKSAINDIVEEIHNLKEIFKE
ncbi:MAG: molybdopterin-binding protein [Thermoplasmata archaeon]